MLKRCEKCKKVFLLQDAPRPGRDVIHKDCKAATGKGGPKE